MNRDRLCIVALTVFCVFFTLAGSGSAATGGFRIEDYIPQKFTDLEWKVDGRVGFNGSANESDQGPSFGGYPTYDSDGDNSSGSFALGSRVVYRYETVARTLNIGGNAGFNYAASNGDNSRTRADSLGLSHRSNINDDIKSYGFDAAPFFEARSYVADDLFAGASGNASIRQSDAHYDNVISESFDKHVHADIVHYSERSSIRDRELDYRDRTAAFALQTGWGRLYEGEFAATALYMIDELKNGGLLERGLSKDEMLELTEIIYQNRMAHEVDHRVSKIDALNAVLEYLTQNGMINETGHLGYVLIQDVYDYFPRTSRRFGAIVKLGVGWEYYYRKSVRSTDAETTRLSYQHHPDSTDVVDTTQNSHTFTYDESITFSELDNTFLNLGVEYHRPVSMRWQLDASADLFYYLDAEGLKTISSRIRVPARPSGGRLTYVRGLDDYYQIRLNCMGTWIYNSRTDLKSSMLFGYDHYQQTYDDTGSQMQTNKDWVLQFVNSMTYRISIPTSLRVGLSYTATSDKTTDETYNTRTASQWSLSASISHYLY